MNYNDIDANLILPRHIQKKQESILSYFYFFYFSIMNFIYTDSHKTRKENRIIVNRYKWKG